MNLRRRIVATHQENKSSILTAARHGVSGSWVRRRVGRERETGSREPRSCAGKARNSCSSTNFGANTETQRAHGRGTPGERVVAAAPHGHYKSIGTIAALNATGVVASATFAGGASPGAVCGA